VTRLASHRPPYCAACFQHPEGRCVDFEAAYDGPVIPGTPEPVPVDDLVICESCLSEAFALLDPQGLRETIEELTQLLLEAQEDVKAKDRAIKGAEATISELVDHPIKKYPGKPKLIGVSDEVREQISSNRYKRNGTTPRPTGEKKEKAKA
jgi:hypothetical protein